MELADQHAAESDGALGGAEIPSAGDTSEGVNRQDRHPSDTSADKPLSLREQIVKNVESARARDEAGRFTKESAGGTESRSAEAERHPSDRKVASEGTSQAGVATGPADTAKPSGPPPGWSQASKDFFNSLPADHPLRQDVFKREEEVSNGFKSYSDKTKQYDAVEQAVAPHRARFQQFGVQSDAEAINSLFQWEQSFANPHTRMQAFSNLAQRYGVDLSQFARQSPAPSEGGQDIPEHLRPAFDKIGSLEQRLEAQEQARQRAEQAQAQAEQARINEQLSSFAKDHPHFDKVRVAMGHLMSGGIASSLDDAYQRAVWADPDIRAQMMQEQETKAKAEQAKAHAEAAEKARKAAISPAPRARQAAPVNGSDKSAQGVRGSILNALKELREDQRA